MTRCKACRSLEAASSRQQVQHSMHKEALTLCTGRWGDANSAFHYSELYSPAKVNKIYDFGHILIIRSPYTPYLLKGDYTLNSNH